MMHVVHLDPLRDAPRPDAVLGRRGLPPSAQISTGLRGLLEEAVGAYAALARPRGMYEELSRQAFAEVHTGEGRNVSPAPLEEVSARGTHFALFAATVGDAVAVRVSRLFAEGQVLRGYLLDAVASEAVDQLSARLAEGFARRLDAEEGRASRLVLPYSPGYCGWDLTGQRRLFALLRPHRIGITLSDHDLMWPLKSVSGVLVGGPPRAHRFRPAYAFCAACETRECTRRFAATRTVPA